MKKNLFSIFVAVVVAMSLASILIGCDNTNHTLDGTGGTNTALSENEVLAFSAATSVNLLSELFGSNAMSAAPAPQGVLDAQINKIHEQIVVMEDFISDTPFTVTEEVSDNALYQRKLTVSAVDLENQAATYIIYFNEILQPADPDDSPYEKEYFLNGIVVLNQTEYRIHGEKETDTRKSEYEISIFVYLDNGTFVKFEYETDRSEKEYEYEIVRNGRTVKKFSLEYEKKLGVQSLELKNFDLDGMRIRYNRETLNEQTFIKATVTDATGSATVKIFVTRDEAGNVVYRYVLPSGMTKDIVRHKANATTA